MRATALGKQGGVMAALLSLFRLPTSTRAVQQHTRRFEEVLAREEEYEAKLAQAQRRIDSVQMKVSALHARIANPNHAPSIRPPPQQEGESDG